jgi:hypothetical protein
VAAKDVSANNVPNNSQQNAIQIHLHSWHTAQTLFQLKKVLYTTKLNLDILFPGPQRYIHKI